MNLLYLRQSYSISRCNMAQTKAQRSAAAKKAARTRKRNAAAKAAARKKEKPEKGDIYELGELHLGNLIRKLNLDRDLDPQKELSSLVEGFRKP